MQIIRNLVGFNTNQAGFDFAQGTGKRGNIYLRELLWESFLHCRVLSLPKRQRTSNAVFPEARLRLVCAHGGTTNDGCAYQTRIAALFVEGVTAFMDSCHNRHGEEMCIGARGDAYIEGTAKAGGERMGGLS